MSLPLLQTVSLSPGQGLAENLQGLTLSAIIGALIVLILVIAAVIFFIMLLIGGIRWMTAGGDKAATEAARNQITAALVGLVIVFAAWAILQLVQVFFGVNLTGELTLPNAQDF